MDMETEKDPTLERRISVGVVAPEFLEGNIVYVQLRQKAGAFSAEAISDLPFNSLVKLSLGYITERGKKADSDRFQGNGQQFIDMLVQQNHGQISYRFYEDSYRLSGMFR